MSLSKNRYILADISLLRSRRTLIIGTVVVLFMIGMIAGFLLPQVGRYQAARTFAETLYETTKEDLADPTQKIATLRTLATDEVVEELLRSGGIPAAELHDMGANALTWYEHGTLEHDEHPDHKMWTDALAGSVKIHDYKASMLLSGWRGTLLLRVEKVNSQWTVTAMQPIDWQVLYQPEI